MSIRRTLDQAILTYALNRNKMAFIAGPRQTGKTTLSQMLKQNFQEFKYLNWDESEFRRQWTKNPQEVLRSFDLTQTQSKRLLILDEIHKSKLWKQKLKGIYDHHKQDINIIVTGSAHLDHFQKGGDSLMGRYVHFRLHPFTLAETMSSSPPTPDAWMKAIFTSPPSQPNTQQKSTKKITEKNFARLLKFSGFPEPYLEKNENIHRIWQKDRNTKIVREDLRDLSRIPELSQVEMLTSLLPSKVGNPLSVQSLREDLEVAHDTVSRWLKYLNQLYYYFQIKPYTTSITRSMKKEPKIYLYDWTELADPGVRFENVIASHLIKACHYWTDTGEGRFDLHYLRNKERIEVDFLITRDQKPWLAIESKINDTNIDPKKIEKLVAPLNCPMIQVVQPEGVFKLYKDILKKHKTAVMSATHLLSSAP